MKSIKILFAMLVAMTLISCGTYPDGTSVWAKGAWIAFLLPFLVSFIFLYYAVRAHNSGQIVGGSSSDPHIRPTSGKTPYHRIPQFWFFVAFQLAAWIVVVVQNAEK